MPHKHSASLVVRKKVFTKIKKSKHTKSIQRYVTKSDTYNNTPWLPCNTPAKKRVMKFQFKGFWPRIHLAQSAQPKYGRFCQIDIKDILDLVTRRQGQYSVFSLFYQTRRKLGQHPNTLHDAVSWAPTIKPNRPHYSLISINQELNPPTLYTVDKFYNNQWKSYQTKCGYPCMHSCFYAYKFNLKQNKHDITPYLLRL